MKDLAYLASVKVKFFEYNLALGIIYESDIYISIDLIW